MVCSSRSQHFSHKLCINKLVSRLNSLEIGKIVTVLRYVIVILRCQFTTRCLFKTFSLTTNGQFVLLIYVHSHLVFYSKWHTHSLPVTCCEYVIFDPIKWHTVPSLGIVLLYNPKHT